MLFHGNKGIRRDNSSQITLWSQDFSSLVQSPFNISWFGFSKIHQFITDGQGVNLRPISVSFITDIPILFKFSKYSGEYGSPGISITPCSSFGGGRGGGICSEGEPGVGITGGTVTGVSGSVGGSIGKGVGGKMNPEPDDELGVEVEEALVPVVCVMVPTVLVNVLVDNFGELEPLDFWAAEVVEEDEAVEDLKIELVVSVDVVVVTVDGEAVTSVEVLIVAEELVIVEPGISPVLSNSCSTSSSPPTGFSQIPCPSSINGAAEGSKVTVVGCGFVTGTVLIMAVTMVDKIVVTAKS
ncbi:hypothetical protein WICPIJ_003903 [Wickerhamomyces pijperi]|uniref:Uncharacterized protein n=1 Tax=Wickerhamomyces pijperi TaxID=599730 RepID=A0A9P8Q6Z1_WICPI|nr:hypothetical protein WICPIJ_003903 [Wickerhamomyces pijperi]